MVLERSLPLATVEKSDVLSIFFLCCSPFSFARPVLWLGFMFLAVFSALASQWAEDQGRAKHEVQSVN